MRRRQTFILIYILTLSILFSGCFTHESANATTPVTAATSAATSVPTSTTSSSTSTSASTATTTSTAASTTITTTATTTTAPDPELPQWTIMEYLCGTDLETKHGLATANLEELRKVSCTDGTVQYVIQTGGTSTWHCDVDGSKLQRWALGDNELLLMDEQELASMGASNTLADFLRWGAENYPAQHYMLIIWDHGGGSISGVTFDELFNQDSLTLPELSDALRASGVYFDVVGFDACLMANLETAQALSPFAGYMVASEETIPGSGWDYEAFTDYLIHNPDSSPQSLSVKICDTYMDKCVRLESEAMATLSVIDLDNLYSLSVCFDNMAQEMESLTSDISRLVTLSQSSKRAESYGGNTSSDGYSNLVDLGDLVMEARGILPMTASDTLDALFNTVVYSVSGPNRAYANGLSVFYPLKVDADICAAYSRICQSNNYLRFINALVEEWEAPAYIDNSTVESVTPDDFNVDLETYLSDDACYTLEIVDGAESVDQVLFSLFFTDYDGNMYISLGTDDDIATDWDSCVFKDNFRGTWLSIDGCFCAPELLAQEDEYNLYSIPILLNGEETNLRIAYLWEDACYQLIGACDGLDSETGMASRDIRELNNGDIISPIFECYDIDSFEMTRCILDEIVVNGSPVIEEIELVNGDYLYQFELRDVFNNSYFSEACTMTVSDGEITVAVE